MKFENLYIECENLEQRDEVISICLKNGYKRGFLHGLDLNVLCSKAGKVYDIKESFDLRGKGMLFANFMSKYNKNNMIKSIENAMTELKLNREGLSLALGKSKPYISKMMTKPQSESTQDKVVKMIEELMKPKVVCNKDKIIKELNQALEYKDQLIKNEIDLSHKQGVVIKKQIQDINDLQGKIDFVSKREVDATKTLDLANTQTDYWVCENLKSENETKNIHAIYIVVIMISLAICVWGYYA